MKIPFSFIHCSMEEQTEIIKFQGSSERFLQIDPTH